MPSNASMTAPKKRNTNELSATCKTRIAGSCENVGNVKNGRFARPVIPVMIEYDSGRRNWGIVVIRQLATSASVMTGGPFLYRAASKLNKPVLRCIYACLGLVTRRAIAQSAIVIAKEMATTARNLR